MWYCAMILLTKPSFYHLLLILLRTESIDSNKTWVSVLASLRPDSLNIVTKVDKVSDAQQKVSSSSLYKNTF